MTLFQSLTYRSAGEKSATQSATDTISGTGSDGKGVLEQGQEALGNAANTVKDTLGLSEYNSNNPAGHGV